MIAQTEIISEKHGVLIVNFGHAGDGNIHVNLLLGDKPGDDERVHGAIKDVFDAAIGLGGRISGEHGIGLAKRDYIGWNLDAPTLGMMRRVKRMFDPNNILNPGKIFP
jgi:glycolate oxidase